MRNHDGLAAKRSGSLAYKVFPRVNRGVSRFVDVGHDQGKVQASPKSDRVSFIFFEAAGASAEARIGATSTKA